MAEVVVYGSDFEGALRRFKMIVAKSGILSELKMRKSHPTKASRKKFKMAQALKRKKRSQARHERLRERRGLNEQVENRN